VLLQEQALLFGLLGSKPGHEDRVVNDEQLNELKVLTEVFITAVGMKPLLVFEQSADMF
jgi:hypothetical protein